MQQRIKLRSQSDFNAVSEHRAHWIIMTSSAALKVHLNSFSSLTGSENDSSEQMSKLKESVTLSSDKPMSQSADNQPNRHSVSQIFNIFLCRGDVNSCLFSSLTGGVKNCRKIQTFSSLYLFFFPFASSFLSGWERTSRTSSFYNLLRFGT